MTIHKTLCVCGVSLCLIMMASHVFAQEAPQNIGAVMQKVIETQNNSVVRKNEISAPIAVPATNSRSPAAQQNKDALYLTPGRSEVIKLDRDGASVVVSNPDYINVFLDSPRTAVIVPRSAGATEFNILADDGTIILNKMAIVSTETDKKYVRIHRICGGQGGRDCKEETVYYCEDSCVEMSSGNTGSRRN